MSKLHFLVKGQSRLLCGRPIPADIAFDFFHLPCKSCLRRLKPGMRLVEAELGEDGKWRPYKAKPQVQTYSITPAHGALYLYGNSSSGSFSASSWRVAS